MNGWDPVERFERLAAARAILKSGQRDQTARNKFVTDFAQTRIRKHAARFEHKLECIAAREAIRQQVFGTQIRLPDVNPQAAIRFGEITAADRADLNQHTLIVGASGWGKSFGTRNILGQEIPRHTRVISLAAKDEDRCLIYDYPQTVILQPDDLPINLLAIGGERIPYLSLIFNEIGRHRSWQPQRINAAVNYVDRLYRGLRPGDPEPSLQDLERLLVKETDALHRGLGHEMASVNAVLGKTASVRRGIPLFEENQIVVIELHKHSPRVGDMICGCLLGARELAAMERGHSTELQTLCVIDEAGIVCRKETSGSETFGFIPWVKRFARRARSYGIGFIWSAQSLADLEPSLLENHRQLLVFRLPALDQARHAQLLLGLSETAVPLIQNLDVRECFVRIGNSAVKDKIPLGTRRDYPSDAQVAEHMRAFWARTEARLVRSPAAAQSAPVCYLESLGEVAKSSTPAAPPKAAPQPTELLAEYWEMLREIKTNGTASISTHYQNLGWSAGKGQRVKQCLLDLGLITNERQKSTSGRPRELLVLSQTAEELLRAY